MVFSYTDLRLEYIFAQNISVRSRLRVLDIIDLSKLPRAQRKALKRALATEGDSPDRDAPIPSSGTVRPDRQGSSTRDHLPVRHFDQSYVPRRPDFSQSQAPQYPRYSGYNVSCQHLQS